MSISKRPVKSCTQSGNPYKYPETEAALYTLNVSEPQNIEESRWLSVEQLTGAWVHCEQYSPDG